MYLTTLRFLELFKMNSYMHTVLPLLNNLVFQRNTATMDGRGTLKLTMNQDKVWSYVRMI